MRTITKFSLLITVFCLSGLLAMAQKRPLDHDVYDGWQNVSGASISQDGKYVYYLVNPQQGDSKLHIHDGQRHHSIGTIDRAASISLSPSGNYLTMLIKPLYAETREARIQKKRGDDMPKDSLGIFSLRDQQLVKIPNVKSFKAPSDKGDVIAYLADQEVADEKKSDDSTEVSGEENARPSSGRGGGRKKTEAVLTVYQLGKGVDTTFTRVGNYYFTDNGENLFFVREAAEKDSVGQSAGVYHYHIPSRVGKQISSGKGTYKNFAFDEDAKRLAFLAYQGDEKALNKVHEVWLYNFSADSAQVWVSAGTPGIPTGWQVGDGGSLQFSKDQKRLFFGIAPEPRVKDTTLVEFEHAKVDIWHWQDDYLQTQQLVNLRREQNRTYQAVISINEAGPVLPLADEKLPDLRLPQEGAQEYALGTTDYGRRIESQWLAGTYQDIYLVSTLTGERTLVKENVRGSISMSPNGKYVLWFDRSDGNWHVYDIAQKRTRILNENILTPFANEDHDSPDDPNGYGIAGWSKDDTEVFINDKYDIWAFDLEKETYRSITNGYGRLNQITLRYQNLQPSSSGGRGGFGRGAADPINARRALWLSAFNHKTKENGWFKTNPRSGRNPSEIVMGPYRYAQARGGEDTDMIIYTKENYVQSPDLYISKDFKNEVQLSHINPQQASYNWGTAELFEWTTPKGYAAQGILYKPEDFDPNKKYPVIAYFYEIVSNGLYSYVPPTPTPSRLNISFFVSNGYIVLAPDIHYEIGYPGRSAEEYVNSGMLALARNSWVDSGALGIQGQSWGGYQVAHLITRTDMYAAAWSGAPVVNMTSAYGGIRWQSGMNRQFQYERTQSRIGATLWEDLDLYIENSPLFHFPNVTTPVAIMHNDEDGAVPWYQGIEMFTGLRRLGKPVWLLNYNGDAHNLVQRQNRKDIQRRQKEFFDHFLKGEPAAPWIERGIPAIHKGIDWGFREDQ